MSFEGRNTATPVTPPDPKRGVCPTCGMWAKLPEKAVNEDTMHAAQVAALRRADRGAALTGLARMGQEWEAGE